MKLQIHHPRILLVLLMMIGDLTTSALLLADQGEELPTESARIPMAPISTTLSKQEEQDAVNIVKASRVVESVNGARIGSQTGFTGPR